MRFVPRNCIGVQSKLAMSIIGSNGELLLRDGMTMTQRYADKLEELSISGAYIDDEISKDLIIRSAISEEVKSEAVKGLISTYSDAKTGIDKKTADAKGKAMFDTASKMVNEIVAQGDAMLNLLDVKSLDSFLYFHCLNVATISIVIGRALDFNMTSLIQLAYAALLHDIGKAFVEPELLTKAELDMDEQAKLKKHAREGYEYVRTNYYSTINTVTARGILDHHERVDGLGYPNSLKEHEISDFGKIIAVADCYDNMISDTHNKKGVFPADAIEYIQGNCGTLFDLKIVQAFTRKIAPFQVGTSVKLSDESIALVMENYEGAPQRPKVKVFKKGNEDVEPYILSLNEEAFSTTVVSMIEI